MRHHHSNPATRPDGACLRRTALPRRRAWPGGLVVGLALCAAASLAQPTAPASATASAPASAAASAPATAAASAPAAAPVLHPDALRVIDLWLEAQRAYDRVPAVSAAVVVGQAVVYRRGFGHIDAARQVAATPESIYSICSISKLFTSVAAMQLWEQGKLPLDTDIGQLLPEFAIQRTDPDSGPITVRGLLTHASGLPREADAAYWTAPNFVFPDRATLLQSLRGQRTFMRAGDHHQYSNLGMALLGELVAAASGQPYADHVQQHILTPLQMADTRTTLPQALLGQRLAQGFGALQRDGQRPVLASFDARAMAPAAGFSSTVDDLARFARWQLRLHAQGGQELLKLSTLREMQRVHWTDPDGKTTWGLGFAVSTEGGQAIAAHSGWCPGYRSALAVMPGEQLAVATMTNVGDANGVVPYGRALRQLALKGLKLKTPAADAPAPRLTDYAGRYNPQPWASELLVLPWGGSLAVLSLPSRDPAGDLEVLSPLGGDRFRYTRPDGTPSSEVLFERDASGQVVALREWGQRTPRVAVLP